MNDSASVISANSSRRSLAPRERNQLSGDATAALAPASPTPAAPTPALPSEVVAAPAGAPARTGRWSSRWARLFSTISCQALIFGIQTLQAVGVARMLGPEARGQYATALFYPQTLLYAGLLGTLLSIARRAGQPGTPVAELRRAAVRTGWWIGCANFLVVVGLALLALPAEKAALTLACLFCGLLLPVEHARLALLSVDHGREAFHRYNAQRLFAALIFPVFVAALWVAGYTTLQPILAAAVAAPVVGLAAMRWGVSESCVVGPRAPSAVQLVREGLPYGAAQVSAALLERLDLVLVLWLSSFRDQGLYAAAVPAVSLLLIAPHAVALFAFNAGVRQSGPLEPRRVAAAFAKLGLFQAGTAVALALVLDPVIRIAFGAEFAGSVPVAIALLPAYALSGLARSVEALLQGHSASTRGVGARLLGAATMLVAAALLLSRYALVGIALAASIGHAVTALWLMGGLVSACRGYGASELSDEHELGSARREPA